MRVWLSTLVTSLHALVAILIPLSCRWVIFVPQVIGTERWILILKRFLQSWYYFFFDKSYVIKSFFCKGFLFFYQCMLFKYIIKFHGCLFPSLLIWILKWEWVHQSSLHEPIVFKLWFWVNLSRLAGYVIFLDWNVQLRLAWAFLPLIVLLLVYYFLALFWL